LRWNYTTFFSTLSNVNKFQAGRAFGLRSGVFFPKVRLEVGGSYERFLQDRRINSYGTYWSWQPTWAPLDIKGEYAHSPSGHGYWLEGAYFLRKNNSPRTWLGRMQTVGRIQQFYRIAPGVNDFLPRADTQQFDFGLNYYLPH